ncbi:MAG: GAF domain-containing protein [Vulcanimicrobiota bacterium]
MSSRLVKKACQHLGRLGRDHRTLVFLKSGGQLTVRAMRNFPHANLDDEAIAWLIAEVEQKGKPVLVLDAHQDERFRGLPQPGFRAAVCAPILREGELIGLLYVDAPQPGAFSYANLSEFESYGVELGGHLKAEVPVTPPAQASLQQPFVGGWPLVVCGLAAFILLLALLLGWGKKPPPPPPKSQLPTLETAGPETIARSFLSALQGSQLGTAYELLSPRLREKLTREQFEQRVKTWLSQGKNAWELQYRRPAVEEQDDSKCVLALERIGPEQAKSWHWRLVKTPTGWTLDRLEGGPVLE